MGRKLEKLMASLTVEEACVLLDHCGSSTDPIEYKGEDRQASDLDDYCIDGPGELASKVRIVYFGKRKGQRAGRKRGTLTGMVRDRIATDELSDEDVEAIIIGRDPEDEPECCECCGQVLYLDDEA